MGLLEQLDRLLQSKVSRAIEYDDACRGARLLGPASRANADRILYPQRGQGAQEEAAAAPSREPDGDE